MPFHDEILLKQTAWLSTARAGRSHDKNIYLKYSAIFMVDCVLFWQRDKLPSGKCSSPPKRHRKAVPLSWYSPARSNIMIA